MASSCPRTSSNAHSKHIQWVQLSTMTSYETFMQALHFSLLLIQRQQYHHCVQSMLLSVPAEKEAILSEIRLFQRLRYKLSNQLRHFKQFHQLKIVIKHTQRHLEQLTVLEKYDLKQIKTLQVDPYLQSSEIIRNHIISKGQRLKMLLNDAIFLPFATLALGCLAKISFNIDKIEKKIQAIARIVKQLQKKTPLQTKTPQ